MPNDLQTTEEVMKYVAELDINEDDKNIVLSAMQEGDVAKGMRLLRRYRREVLNGLHSEQEKLYQIDFVLQKGRQ